jgi:hypothetical protein
MPLTKFRFAADFVVNVSCGGENVTADMLVVGTVVEVPGVETLWLATVVTSPPRGSPPGLG